MKRKHTTITIPIHLYKTIKNQIRNTGFTSVSSYVTFVLREVVSGEEKDAKTEPFTKEDEEKVRKRLQALGYIT